MSQLRVELTLLSLVAVAGAAAPFLDDEPLALVVEAELEPRLELLRLTAAADAREL